MFRPAANRAMRSRGNAESVLERAAKNIGAFEPNRQRNLLNVGIA